MTALNNDSNIIVDWKHVANCFFFVQTNPKVLFYNTNTSYLKFTRLKWDVEWKTSVNMIKNQSISKKCFKQRYGYYARIF